MVFSVDDKRQRLNQHACSDSQMSLLITEDAELVTCASYNHMRLFGAALRSRRMHIPCLGPNVLSYQPRAPFKRVDKTARLASMP